MDRGSRGVVGKRNRVTDSKRDTGMRHITYEEER